MIRECLKIMDSGNVENLFEIIPRIGVLRDQRFKEPLLRLLAGRNIKLREFAAYAMGAMGDREFLDPLKNAFQEALKLKGAAAQSLQIATIEAIGVLGDDAAVDFFLPLLEAGNPQQLGKLPGWITESLGAIAQQGGERSAEALLKLTYHEDHELRAHAISELSVAFWHRPNEIPEAALERIHELARDRNAAVAESALAALQSLADVGCRRAETLFRRPSR